MDSNKIPESWVEAGMHVDLAGQHTYGEYLKLDLLLAAQQPISQQHDEVAFIIIHHVQELWLKLVAHEIEAAILSIRADCLPPAFKSLARVTRIQEQLIAAWDVLSTMTPADYLAFRSALGPASGFQSYQYRLVEFRLGAKDANMVLPHRHDTLTHGKLMAALNEPSLMMRRYASSPAAAIRSRRKCSIGTFRNPTFRTRGCATSGYRFTANRSSTLTSTN